MTQEKYTFFESWLEPARDGSPRMEVRVAPYVHPPRERPRSHIDEMMEMLCDPGVWRELGHVNDLIRELNMEGW